MLRYWGFSRGRSRRSLGGFQSERPIKAEIEQITKAGRSLTHFDGVSRCLHHAVARDRNPALPFSLINIIRIHFDNEAALSPDA